MPTTMTPRSGALVSALVAVLLASAAAAEPLDAPDRAAAAAAERGRGGAVRRRAARPDDAAAAAAGAKASATNPVAERRASTGWDARLGVDYRRPSFPAADLQPDQLLPGSVQEQSTGVAWANVTAPGLESPLGWDKTSIETRLDPSRGAGQARHHPEPLGAGRERRLGDAAERLFGHAHAAEPGDVGRAELGRPVRRCVSTCCRPTPRSRSAPRSRAARTNGCAA